ncbi:hypothetical protein NQ318_004549 [Aromia moschata]|uniref:Reverse transcriptase domain-containing protein n=1 Tax=Aromia moschata TaxID=1265417 RepID=A0AAV8XQT2_9CUCU|nr:hypothetical protein NQ318_004549 [Aromia moschata]
MYTSDIPNLEHETIATFADVTAVIAVGRDHEEAAEKLQIAINKIITWTKTWRIKLNENKSIHVDFTKKGKQHLLIRINDTQIPYADSAKYLGMILDARLRWRVHVKKKREELGLKLKKMSIYFFFSLRLLHLEFRPSNQSYLDETPKISIETFEWILLIKPSPPAAMNKDCSATCPGQHKPVKKTQEDEAF